MASNTKLTSYQKTRLGVLRTLQNNPNFVVLQTRNKTIIIPSKWGGKSCPLELNEQQQCETSCDFNVKNWGLCDPNTGKTTRSKTLKVKNSKTLKNCPAEVRNSFYCFGYYGAPVIDTIRETT